MRSTVNIAEVSVDKVTMEQAVGKVRSFLEEDRVHTIYTPNAEIIMCAHRDPEFRKVLNEADLVIPDGAGVVLASRILKTPLPEKVSGVDLVRNTFEAFSGEHLKCFLFGGKPGVAEKASENVKKAYPGIEIVGCRNGYFSKDDVAEIIDCINSSGADMLLVALGAPKQEKWIHEHKDKLKVKVCIGVGGTIDVLAGVSDLAPEFIRRHGFEWLYRLYREPRRFKRMLDLPRFIMLTISLRLTGKTSKTH